MAMKPLLQCVSRAAAIQSAPPVFRPAAIQRSAAPPVYRPQTVGPAEAKSAQHPGASAVFQPKIQLHPSAPRVYRPHAAAPVQPKLQGPPVYRPHVARPMQPKLQGPPVYRPHAAALTQPKLQGPPVYGPGDRGRSNQPVQLKRNEVRVAPVMPVPRVIQPFGVNPTFQFATGHTSQPMSLELIQIGDTNKKHHTIPDNVLLTYLGSKRRSLSLDDLDDWATAAIDEEVARLQLAKQKWDAFRAFDDALYGVNPAASSQFPATCLDTFLTAYPQKHLAAISQFETAQKLIKAYNSKIDTYPAAAERNILGWRERTAFELFFGVAKIHPSQRAFVSGAWEAETLRVNTAIKAKLNALKDQLNTQEYLLFSSEVRKMGRIPATILTLQGIKTKIQTRQVLEDSEVKDSLVPLLTWVPANITIGPADRRWEPGEDLDIETLSQTKGLSDKEALIRLSSLLRDDKGHPLIDPGKLTNGSARVLEILEETVGSNIPALLKELTKSRPAPLGSLPASTTLAPGPKETSPAAWENLLNQTLRIPVPQEYVEFPMPGVTDILKGLFGGLFGRTT